MLVKLGAAALSCIKCGSRMVTKVGRTNTMLICSDCGHPRADKAQPHRVKVQNVATAAFLAAVTALTMAVLRVSITRSLPLVPASAAQAE